MAGTIGAKFFSLVNSFFHMQSFSRCARWASIDVDPQGPGFFVPSGLITLTYAHIRFDLSHLRGEP